jgi:nucleoside-diphosphate-sugar epimerase
MRIFVAGGSGTIGVPLVRALVRAGHQVTAMTRSPGKQAQLAALGAAPALADAFDAATVRRVVAEAGPDVVIHQLTALPKEGPKSAADLEGTNRLRVEGTRNLLAAAVAAGARRFIGGSFALLPGQQGAASADEAAAAVRSMESQIVEASRAGQVEGIVLRYGLFYGPGNPSTESMVSLVRRRRLPVIRGDRGQLPVIHLDDAVGATLAALDHGVAGGVYDVVDDRAVSMTEIVETIAKYTDSAAPFRVPGWLPRLLAPYMARMTSVRMPLSNQKARVELGWHPRYATMSEGLAAMLRPVVS